MINYNGKPGLEFSQDNWGAIISENYTGKEELPKEYENFCVGPIWGNYEAKTKADAWINKTKPGEGWGFTGQWNSRAGTSYC